MNLHLRIRKKVQGGLKLLRLIAVFSSSIATILSSLLPLYLSNPEKGGTLLLLFIFLSIAAILFHGVLVHLFNDYVDYLTGTDAQSPAILSGGSRMIQEGFTRPESAWKLGKWLTIFLLLFAVGLGIFELYSLMTLIFIGVWAAVSYSLPPFRLSYYPFLGEWLSLFPALFFLGIAGPWLFLNEIPYWAYENSLINTLICMGWVMVHHIPDLEADKQAVPQKRTTVVWFAEKFGKSAAILPAIIYIFIAWLFVVWIGKERPFVSIIVALLLMTALFLIGRLKVTNVHHVTKVEKILLLFAIGIAILLGISI